MTNPTEQANSCAAQSVNVAVWSGMPAEGRLDEHTSAANLERFPCALLPRPPCCLLFHQGPHHSVSKRTQTCSLDFQQEDQQRWMFLARGAYPGPKGHVWLAPSALQKAYDQSQVQSELNSVKLEHIEGNHPARPRQTFEQLLFTLAARRLCRLRLRWTIQHVVRDARQMRGGGGGFKPQQPAQLARPGLRSSLPLVLNF
eukprot:602975-Rhodomonas_salina.2